MPLLTSDGNATDFLVVNLEEDFPRHSDDSFADIKLLKKKNGDTPRSKQTPNPLVTAYEKSQGTMPNGKDNSYSSNIVHVSASERSRISSDRHRERDDRRGSSRY